MTHSHEMTGDFLMASRRGRVPAGELELPAVMDIKAAGPLFAALRGVRGRPVVLDGSNVQRLGGQCLQVLLAARAAWALDGQGFAVHAPSAAMEDGLSMLGFTSAALAA